MGKVIFEFDDEKDSREVKNIINRDEFIIAKLITCACFDYYTIDKNTKKICLLVDKLKQINKENL